MIRQPTELSTVSQSETEPLSPSAWVAQMATELESAPPMLVVKRALERFGKTAAISFSGAEDVLLVEYAHQVGLPFRVFSLDTGRLHPETYRLFDRVEKHYGLHIEFGFPDTVQVESLVRTKGMFSFYEDGHEQCCGIRKVAPLVRQLSSLEAWITGQRWDQSPATRGGVPVVEIDGSHRGVGGGELVKIGCEKGRATRPDIKVGICGEHGGDPASIAFCETVKLDYVSCSPFRVPIARLAAAQAALG